MSLCLDQYVIISADSCSIGTLVFLQTSNIVLSRQGEREGGKEGGREGGRDGGR